MAGNKILTPQIKRLLNKYREKLMENGVSVEKVLVFGSQVQGRARPYSDIDVCVVSRDFGRDSIKEAVNLTLVANELDWRIEPRPFTPQALADPLDPFADQIRQTAIEV